MKKRLQLYANSIKISACVKPITLLIFIAIIVAVTIAMSLSLRWIFSGLEDDVYGDFISLYAIDNDEPYDFNDYDKIGNTIAGFYDSGLLSENSENAINLIINNYVMKTKSGRLINTGKQSFSFIVRGYGFTKSEIEKETKILKLPKKFMKANNLTDNELITLAGVDLIIKENNIKNNNLYSNSFNMPYTVDLLDFNYLNTAQITPNQESRYFSHGKFNLSGAQRPLNKAERKILKNFGYYQHYGEAEVSSLLALAIFIPVLIASLVNIILVNMYMHKVNRRKYAIYKVLGMSPYKIAALMFAESILLALIGCGLGIFIDYLLYLCLPITYLKLNHLAWLNYLSIFVITMIVTAAVLSVKIIKQAKAVPIDEKLLN